jgi:putative transposase
MARRLRLEYEGAIYHVINRGNRREPIFRTDEDRVLFLETLGEVCTKTGWQVHAFCLMGNHFHLVIETPEPNLVAGMKWLLGTYTIRFNRRHGVVGHLFSGRYKALIVDGSGNGYLRTVCDYVHLNPVRAKLLGKEDRLRTYRWSSYGQYLINPRHRLAWIRTSRVFGEMGIPKDSGVGRKEFEKRMELRRLEDEPEEWKRVRRGWYLGDAAFRKELIEAMGSRMGAEHYGEERREGAEGKAERIVTEELSRLRWTQQMLETRPKGDIKKIKIARRLRSETTMTAAWIAQRLRMGTKTHLHHLLYWNARDGK